MPPKLNLYPKEIKNFPSIKKDKAVIRKKKIVRRKGYFKICCRNKNTTRLEDKGGDIRIK